MQRSTDTAPGARYGLAILRLLGALALAVIGSSSALAAGPLNAVGVENEYADIIAQIDGRYVRVTAVETDPNTDPHSFEASPTIAREIATANLLVRNGLGYDSWVERILSAAPGAKRKVTDVQRLLHLPDSTPNPHLWYDPIYRRYGADSATPRGSGPPHLSASISGRR